LVLDPLFTQRGQEKGNMSEINNGLMGLEFIASQARLSADELHNVCHACGRVLFATYDLERVRKHLHQEDLPFRENTLWRYRELLPVATNVVSLGEGMTPIFPAQSRAPSPDSFSTRAQV
jgi:threonine synthase